MNIVLKNGVLVLLGALIGYPLMGLLITVVQEWIFGGVGYHESSAVVLLVAGFGTFLSAVAGGWVAGRVVSFKNLYPNLLMCALVVLETTWLIRSGRTHGPLWFDFLAAGSLIAGILLGGFTPLKRLLPRV
jgi:hypothetical protein